MGCTNAKEGSAKKDTQKFDEKGEAKKSSGANGQGGQDAQTTAGGSSAAAGGSDGKAGDGAEGAKTGGGPPGDLNVLNADKMEFKDLVEKEPFHSVYTLGDVLGRGNYSVVKKGTKKGTDQVYAIKCIKEASLTHEDREALKIETAILKGMDSPHIIKLYGFYEEPKENMYYIVTEFVGGGELFDRIIAKEYYSEADAQKLVRTIGTALKYCHDRGVVHRDLKPENILLEGESDESIKIADFGFAKQYDTSSDDALSTSCGTPGYVAPEILNGKKYGKEVDMWSLGVIIYILLCGYPPFHHENQKELFRQIREAKYQFDEEYWSQVSSEAKDLISKLLVIDGSKRLSIDEMLDHVWLKTDVDNNLTDIMPKLQDTMNQRKLKAAVRAVMAKHRMQKLLAGVKSGAEAIAAEVQDADAAAKTAQQVASEAVGSDVAAKVVQEAETEQAETVSAAAQPTPDAAPAPTPAPAEGSETAPADKTAALASQ